MRAEIVALARSTASIAQEPILRSAAALINVAAVPMTEMLTFGQLLSVLATTDTGYYNDDQIDIANCDVSLIIALKL